MITVALAFPLGVMAAVKKGTSLDTMANLIAVLDNHLPAVLGRYCAHSDLCGPLRWLPVAGMGTVWHYILPPDFTLGWFMVAGMMRLLRSSMLDVHGQ